MGLVAALGALVVTFLLVSTGPAARRPLGFSGTWRLVFDDDFGGSSLDRSKWEPNRYGSDAGGDDPFDARAEDAWFSRRNVAVKDGHLVITVRPERRTLARKTYPFSSGVVQTEQHYLVKPGSYIEARISVPRCDGCWPAFWTVAPRVWPPELDIFEFFGTDHQRRPRFNYHLPDRGQTGPDPYGRRTVDYTRGFHVYGMLWDGYQAVPYLDGKPYDVGVHAGMTKLRQGLIINLSVQAGRRPAKGSRMLVDWVKVWRPGNAS
jgi:beta-glucanase (GH16 family)